MNYHLTDCLFDLNVNLKEFFSKLPDEDIKTLFDTAKKQTIKKGNLIFKEGENPSGLIFLSSGSAKVFKYGIGNRELIVRLAKPCSFVGYKALFAESKHTTNAATIENSEILIFNKELLNTIIHTNPEFSSFIIKSLASELSFNMERLINLTQKHLRGRLAESLLLLKEIYGLKEDEQTINIYFTRDNIAHFSNMTTPNAVRTMKAFEEEGIIKCEGKNIQLLNLSQLEWICDHE